MVSAFAAGFSCIAFTVLFGLFGRRYMLTLAFAAVVLAIKPLVEWGKGFAYHVLKVADGSIVDADRLIKDMEKSDPLPFLLVLSVLFGMVFALCSHNRFKPELILTCFAIMIIPSFLSQHTAYAPSLGVFIAGMLALWCASLSFASGYFLAAGGLTNVSMMDRQYRESLRRTTPVNRIKNDNIHFNKYFADSAVIFISLLLTVSITGLIVPYRGQFKARQRHRKALRIGKKRGRMGFGFYTEHRLFPL